MFFKSLALKVETCFPSLMMEIVSHVASTSEKIWEDNKIVLPLFFSSKMKSINTFCIIGSNPDVGSSRIKTSGSFIKAETTASLRLSPSDISLIDKPGSNLNISMR